MAIPKQWHASSQYIKLTVREGTAVLRLAGFSVSLYFVSLYKCEPVRLFSRPRWYSRRKRDWPAPSAVREDGVQGGGGGGGGARVWMVALSIPASYTSHGTRHCVINVGQSVPPLFTCMLGAYSKTKVYQCIYALIDTHRHRLCVHCTCHCSTVRRISQIFYRKKRATVTHTLWGPVENHNHTKEQH